MCLTEFSFCVRRLRRLIRVQVLFKGSEVVMMGLECDKTESEGFLLFLPLVFFFSHSQVHIIIVFFPFIYIFIINFLATFTFTFLVFSLTVKLIFNLLSKLTLFYVIPKYPHICFLHLHSPFPPYKHLSYSSLINMFLHRHFPHDPCSNIIFFSPILRCTTQRESLSSTSHSQTSCFASSTSLWRRPSSASALGSTRVSSACSSQSSATGWSLCRCSQCSLLPSTDT